ncbi:MAG: imelysin family protein [Psychroserpens sp.]|uniref:imelysin family protein n=1 Tax=Psychroserpens sp. TaxID=2020870 RepID=UPI003CC1D316
MKKNSLSVFLLALLIVACSSSDDSSSGESSDGFDRQAMLTNWADNIIIPAYQALDSDLTALVNDKDAFVTAPNQSNLDNLRFSWLEAYKTWQSVEMFNIGKAEELNYAFQMNIFPTNVEDIQNNISSGAYDLANVNNNDAVGFPAVDYLVYGIAASDSEILNTYTIRPNFEASKTYLSDVIDQMKSLTSTVLSDWTSTYRNEFVSNTSNSVTSPTNKFTNDFIFYYEKGLRANKFGIPAGVFSSAPLSDKVEALYNKEASKVLALESLNAVQDFFNGKAFSSNSTSESFKSYLDYLNTIKDGEDLASLINDQFEEAESKIVALDANFALQVETDNAKMTQVFDELQKAVVLLKVDMIQAMSISVDFVDADGD